MTERVAERMTDERAQTDAGAARIREVYHRAANHFQTVLSLLDLQASRPAQPGVAQALKRARQRVHALALLYAQLQTSGGSDDVDMAAYLRSLVEHALAASDVECTLRAHCTLDVDRAATCGMIASELLSNCVQHALPATHKGSVTLVFERLGEMFHFFVRDQGPGLPQSAGSLPEGFGLLLVQSLCDQLKARLDTDNSPAGLTVAIEFRA